MIARAPERISAEERGLRFVLGLVTLPATVAAEAFLVGGLGRLSRSRGRGRLWSRGALLRGRSRSYRGRTAIRRQELRERRRLVRRTYQRHLRAVHDATFTRRTGRLRRSLRASVRQGAGRYSLICSEKMAFHGRILNGARRPSWLTRVIAKRRSYVRTPCSRWVEEAQTRTQAELYRLFLSFNRR